MSGVAAIFYRDGRPATTAGLAPMVAALAHRGPDGAALWTSGPAGLGHRMLRTTPESFHEQLPLASRCGGYAITADARLDNRDELIAALGPDDRPRAEIGDSAIILAAYMRWGERCPERLLGDFAFAIWDERKRRLFCARDFFGVRPLYYFASGRLAAVASEVGPLLTLSEVPRRLDEGRVAEYFVPRLEGESDTNTFYADIRRLPAGSWLSVGLDTTVERRYRSFDHVAPLRLWSDAEYVEAFRSVFDRAVRDRLRSAVPVGSMLSGGVDSTSIVCLAERIYAREGRTLPTFSLVGADPATCPETPFLAALPEGLALERHTLAANDTDTYLDGYILGLEKGDDPFVTLRHLLVGPYTDARDRGIRVLLTGLDGDNVASLPYEYPAYLARGGDWVSMAVELAGAARFWNEPLSTIIRETCVWPLLPAAFRRRYTALRGYNRHVIAHLQPEFVRRNRLAERVEEWHVAEHTMGGSVREQQIRILTAGWAQSALEGYDHAAALLGLEVRHPLLDRRLVELCVALPPEQKVRRGWTKVTLREAVAGLVPEPVRRRRDRNNPSDDVVRHVLAQFVDLLGLTLYQDTAGLESILQLDSLRTLYQRYRQTGASKDAHQLWSVLAFSRWWQRCSWAPHPDAAAATNSLSSAARGTSVNGPIV